MRIKLFLTLLLATALPSLAQTAALTGKVVDADTGNPIAGATVSLSNQNLSSVTGPAGDFSISGANAGAAVVTVNANNYAVGSRAVELYNNQSVQVGTIKLYSELEGGDFYEDHQEQLFDESAIEDEEGNSQSISALTGAADDVYYSTASYNFGPMRFYYRGYDNMYQQVYMNGMVMNDVIRGRFNFSSLLGMTSRAFRNKTTTLGMAAASYGFGDVGGAVNYSTQASNYAPGFNGSVAFTNSNYKLRAMVQYSSGLNSHGWAYSIAGIGRWSDEGVVEGTFYNSVGLFAAIEKVLNPHNSINLTLFAGPTQRATATAVYQEAYDLSNARFSNPHYEMGQGIVNTPLEQPEIIGNNLYNPYWGWQDGKKRSARITETFDPTAMLNWFYKTDRTQVTTGAMFRMVNYSSSALNWRNANDPNPTYYRNLPSYWYGRDDQAAGDYLTWLWITDQSIRQIDWDAMYQTNYLTNAANAYLPYEKQSGANYIQENRHSNQINAEISSYINHRLNDKMSIQGGVSGNYTRGHWYKTIRDLLGGDFWIDVDPFSDRDITLDLTMLQNDLDNPDRRVVKGDTFGYNYYINAVRVQGWAQHVINLAHWDINYGGRIGYTTFQRDGKMRNGRAPENSLGKGKSHSFFEGSAKLGITYKIDGRNIISAHGEFNSQAPLVDNVYISPRVKDTTVDNLQSEQIYSGDISYGWNYRRFRGSITGFYTMMDNLTERSSFYDDRYSCYTNYALTDVRRVYKGIEVGAAFKVTPSVTLTAAGTYARYQYKNNPQGTRSFENGMYADTTQTVYLKNFYVGCNPQYAANIGIDWAAPKNWYFNVNCTWQGDSYVTLSPIYHEAMADLYTAWPGPAVAPDEQAWLEAKVAELTTQDKLKNAFTVNCSIGKQVYINRKIALNFNLNVSNLLNNRNIVTWAYQQSRIDTDEYSRSSWPNRYMYAQGIRVYFNVGVRF